ncbi:hypothetical protein BKA67DRAFT_573377 [Truncatella angustata]|uniref:Uncharacterized protein n=1 Tax=Truncatella angustata TaxID=152316 RepID=A0A9P8UHI6_9PEZI|nr:uncharacterized protein BKA67DRAFT_573377 [Truncatella angustata]KAH6652235.1 hypothetical protein BKA67DRAFT_573377 [Truncatella angustata]
MPAVKQQGFNLISSPFSYNLLRSRQPMRSDHDYPVSVMSVIDCFGALQMFDPLLRI